MMSLPELSDLFRNAHKRSDVDATPKSLHHTLGEGSNQASKGNHNHDGVYLKQVESIRAPGDANQAITAVEADITGATVTIDVKKTTDVFLVIGTFCVTKTNATSGNMLGILSVNGVNQTGLFIFNTGTLVNPLIITGSQMWIITGLPVGNRVFKLRASCAAGTTFTSNSPHTNISVLKLSP